jgi:replicative DNA helicase
VVVDHFTEQADDLSGGELDGRLTHLRDVAKGHEVAVLAIEATSAASELRTDHRPRLEDLPRADLWLDHADAIVLVHDDAAFDPTSPDRGTAELEVVMNLAGPTGMVRVAHFEEAGALGNLERSTASTPTPTDPASDR